MADRAGSHRHSHQHWQRIRMERTDEAYYAGYGFFAEGGYLDLFTGDFVFGYFRRLLGTYVEKYGPRRSGLISMCFFVSGLLGTAYALTQHSLLLLYLFYGVIGGIGLGTGYITPVSTLVKWFPNNRGLATGLAIMLWLCQPRCRSVDADFDS